MVSTQIRFSGIGTPKQASADPGTHYNPDLVFLSSEPVYNLLERAHSGRRHFLLGSAIQPDNEPAVCCVISGQGEIANRPFVVDRT
jgi:hypothetical protein